MSKILEIERKDLRVSKSNPAERIKDVRALRYILEQDGEIRQPLQVWLHDLQVPVWHEICAGNRRFAGSEGLFSKLPCIVVGKDSDLAEGDVKGINTRIRELIAGDQSKRWTESEISEKAIELFGAGFSVIEVSEKLLLLLNDRKPLPAEYDKKPAEFYKGWLQSRQKASKLCADLKAQYLAGELKDAELKKIGDLAKSEQKAELDKIRKASGKVDTVKVDVVKLTRDQLSNIRETVKKHSKSKNEVFVAFMDYLESEEMELSKFYTAIGIEIL